MVDVVELVAEAVSLKMIDGLIDSNKSGVSLPRRHQARGTRLTSLDCLSRQQVKQKLPKSLEQVEHRLLVVLAKAGEVLTLDRSHVRTRLWLEIQGATRFMPCAWSAKRGLSWATTVDR